MEQTVTINTAAAGGNAALISLDDDALQGRASSQAQGARPASLPLITASA
jgi:hypothetical protein